MISLVLQEEAEEDLDDINEDEDCAIFTDKLELK